MHEIQNKDEQGGLKARHLFAGADLITLIVLLFPVLANAAQTPLWHIPCAAHPMQADCLQAFFANIALGAGLNLPQELLKQSLSGERHTRPDGFREQYFRIASGLSLYISVTRSVCCG